jgi:hypothetical protein
VRRRGAPAAAVTVAAPWMRRRGGAAVASWRRACCDCSAGAGAAGGGMSARVRVADVAGGRAEGPGPARCALAPAPQRDGRMERRGAVPRRPSTPARLLHPTACSLLSSALFSALVRAAVCTARLFCVGEDCLILKASSLKACLRLAAFRDIITCKRATFRRV